MLIYLCLFSSFIYFSGLLIFCIKHKHFLLILLRLEFIILSLYFNIFIYISMFDYEFYFRIIFITIRVCEGALGLSILVSIVRTHGNDYFKRFNLLW